MVCVAHQQFWSSQFLISQTHLHASTSFSPQGGETVFITQAQSLQQLFWLSFKASLASWIAVETHIYQVNQTQFWARLRSRNELSVVHWPVFSPLLLPEFQRHLSTWTRALKGNLKRNKREAISEINTKSWNVFQFSCQLQNISNKEWWHISENKLGQYCRCAALILWLLV